jgi:hypothetical protein
MVFKRRVHPDFKREQISPPSLGLWDSLEERID